MKNVKSRLF